MISRQQMVLLLADARSLLVKAVVISGTLSVIAFFFSRDIMQSLAGHVHVELYYFNLSEVFFSSVEVALYTGLFLGVPVIMVLASQQFRQVLARHAVHGLAYVAFAIVLFYAGSVFCYAVVLPSGVGFLLSYQGGALKAMISAERFFRFCTTMIFAFGAAFEIPIILLLLGRFGLVTSRALSRARRYAVLAIVIVASVITPTPDIYNMSLLAAPLYVLYEVGVLLLWLRERRLTPKAKSV